MRASSVAESTRAGSPAHESALADLKMAVQRYTDFSLVGPVPDDLKERTMSASWRFWLFLTDFPRWVAFIAGMAICLHGSALIRPPPRIYAYAD